MARTSRIRHPPGQTFVQVHRWAVAAVGEMAAKVLGHLEFLDSAQPEPSCYLVSQSQLIADLQGLVGKNNVPVALECLIEIGWVKKKKVSEMGKRNIVTNALYSIDADSINKFLGKTYPERESGFSGDVETQEKLKPQHRTPKQCGKSSEKWKGLIPIENDEDRSRLSGLLERLGEVAVEEAANKVMAIGKRPYVSNVQNELEGQKNEKHRNGSGSPSSNDKDILRGEELFSGEGHVERTPGWIEGECCTVDAAGGC